jgi:nucleotide-binding universal stress UspA family protein
MTLVVAVDGSEVSLQAVRSGLALVGDVSDAIVVTVVEQADPMDVTGTGFAGGTMSPAEFDEHQREVTAEGERVVADAVASLGLTDARTRVLYGQPGAALCNFAADSGARGIVIGSRGRGGLKRALLGSVSDHVVRNAPCPVVVSGEGDDAA